MQRRLHAPWSPHIGLRGSERARYEEIPTIPGSFPADVPELADPNRLEIQEPPATIPNELAELESSVSDKRTASDWRLLDIAPVSAQENVLDLQLRQQQGR